MAEQAWSPAEESTGGANARFPAYGDAFSAPPPPLPPPVAKQTYELRPLTTGELLDRTFYLYRANFWLFVGLASVAAATQVVTELAKLVWLHFFGVAGATLPMGLGGGSVKVPGGPVQTMVFYGISLVATVLYFVVYGVTQAATTSAVTAIYLGDATSMKLAFRAVMGRWLRFFGIALWQIWSAMWLFFLLIFGIFFAAAALGRRTAGSPGTAVGVGLFAGVAAIAGTAYGVIAFIRNSFAVPAAVMEGLKVRKAMRRSKQLIAGSKGRVFLLYLFMMVLYFVAIAIHSPLAIFILRAKGEQQLLLQALNLFVGFFTSSVIGPVAAIGLCLFYIDQRIRKEGFDIEFLMERSGPVPEPFAEPIPEPLADAAAAELP